MLVVDSDDYIDYNMYEELFDVIKCHDVDIVYSNFQTEYLDGRIEGCVKTLDRYIYAHRWMY